MGTIAEKLTYLNDTRLKIKDGLNKFGADLTENDTFRSYSNVLNDIYDKLPKVSGNGSNFTLENAQKGKLDLFEMEGNTHQDSYSGINLLSKQGFSTPSNDTSYWEKQYDMLTPLEDGWGRVVINDSSSSQKWINLFIKKGNIDLEPNTQYTFVVEIKNVSGFTAYKLSQNNVSEVWSEDINANINVTTQQKFLNQTKSDFSNVNFDLRTFLTLPANKTGAIDIRMMILKGDYTNIDIDYEPYVGGNASPNPDYPQEIEVVENKQVVNVSGKNLLQIVPSATNKRGTTTTYNEKTGYITTTGTTTAGFPWISQNLTNIPAGKEVIISSNSQYRIYARFYYTEDDYEQIDSVSTTKRILTHDINKIVILSNASSGITINETYYIQIEENSTATPFEKYHNQDYGIDLHGKNLFDKENANILNAYIALGNSKITSSNADKCLYIPIKADTTYTISKILSNRFVIGCVDEEPVLNSSVCNPISGNQTSNTTYTITSGNNSQYLVVFYYTTSDTLTEQEILDSIQIEQNSTATEYEEFYDYKLCKIGDYQDVIFKNNQLSSYYDSTLDEDSWYIKKAFGKVVFDGTEGWYKYNITANNLYRLSETIFEGYAYGSNVAEAFCNIYGVTNLSGLHDKDSTFKGVGIRDNGQINIWTSLNEYPTLADFKNMLLNKNMIIVGRLKDTTYEIITNETLINQLEALETETGTNIFEVSNDNDVLPSLNVKRLKELEKLS